jgi:hypothetical protein
MKINPSIMRAVVYTVHSITALAVVILTVNFPRMMPMMIIVGGLIGVASATTVTHRYSSLFVAFGLMLAPSFALTIAAVNQSEFLELLPPVLLVIGVSWSLQRPGWIPLGFSAFAVSLVYLICRDTYIHRFENDYGTPEEVIQAVVVYASMVTLSFVQAAVGVTQAMTSTKPKAKKKKSPQIAIPTVDEF